MSKKKEKANQLIRFHNNLITCNFDFQCLISQKLQAFQWSEKLEKQCLQNTQKTLQRLIQDNQNPQQFWCSILPYFVDCIYRKGQIRYFYNTLKRLTKSPKFSSLSFFNAMSFSDFIILCFRKIQQSCFLGQLLSQNRVPLPIYYETNSQNYIFPSYSHQILKQIMIIKDYAIIMNAGSQKTKGKGKTKTLYDLFSLPVDLNYDQKSVFYQNSLYAHTQFQMNKQKIIFDFNGSIENIPDSLIQIFQNISLLFMYFTQEQVVGQFLKGYENMVQKSKIVILIILNCKQLENQQLQQFIPQNFRDKVFGFCLTVSQYDSDLLQIVKFIQKRNILADLKPNFSYLALINDHQKIKVVKDAEIEVKNTISLLQKNTQNQHQSMDQIFCHISLNNRIRELQNSIIQKSSIIPQYKQQVKRKYTQQLQQQKNKRINLEQKLQKMYEKSKFVEKGFQLIIKGMEDSQYLQIFQKQIYEWKKEKINPIMHEYILITNKISDLSFKQIKMKEQLMVKLKNLEKNIDSNDISILTIMNQIVVTHQKCENKKLSQQQQKIRKQQQKYIQRFYENSHLKAIPTSIVDGKNLTFGNKFLKEFIKQLGDKKYKNKPVYIISIIGAQSSAKSTLLNYLFRCQFQTSAGRCTKGMYFTIVQCENKVLFIIDTEGLLSVNARDMMFDNRVATFVLSISNLVIINNKGQLTSTLRDMLHICMFAMDALRKNQNSQNTKPQNILFALRDQKRPKQNEKFQEQMVAKIKNQFEQSKEKFSIDYNKFFDINSQNILSFPSAYVNQKVRFKQFGSFQAYDQVFSSCIRGLRSRIIQILNQQEGRKSLSDCYIEAQNCWNAILKCGDDLMNYKTYLEYHTKQLLIDNLRQQQKQFKQTLLQQFQDIYREFEPLKSLNQFISYQKVVIEKLNNKKNCLCQIFKNKFKDNSQFCRNQEWIQACYEKILNLCQSYQNNYLKRIQQQKNTRYLGQLTQDFASRIKLQIDGILANKKQEADIKKQIQEIKSKFEKQLNIKLDSLKNSESYQIMQYEIMGFVKSAYPQQKISQNSATWVQECKKIRKIPNNLVRLFWVNHLKLCTENDRIKCIQLGKLLFKQISNGCYLQKKITNCSNQLMNLSKLRQQYDTIIIKSYEKVQRQLQIINKQYFTSFRMGLMNFNNVLMKDILRGSLIQSIAETIKIYKQQNLVKIADSITILIKKQQKNIQKAIKSRDNIKQMSKLWYDQLTDFYKIEYKKICEKACYKKLEHLKRQFDSERIISFGLKKSLLMQKNGKQKWIQCFKIITNINYYLFEKLFNQPSVNTRSYAINEVMIQNKPLIESYYKNITDQIEQIVKIIPKQSEDIEHKITKKDSQKIQDSAQKHVFDYKSSSKQYQPLIRDFKNKYRLKNMSNSSDIKILEILNTQLKQLKKKADLIEQIYNSLPFQELQTVVNNYFLKQLKQEVIGCQHTCPLCGMKCSLGKNHIQGHQIMRGCHVMQAFTGFRKITKNGPSYGVCMSKKSFMEKYRRNGQKQQISLPLLQYLQKHYKQWVKHFQNQQRLAQLSQQSTIDNYNRIWANIGDLLIKYKFPRMKNDHKYQDLKQDPLTEQDLETIKYRDFYGVQKPLRQYMQQK